MPLLALIVNWPLVSQRGEHAVRAEAEQFLGQVAPDAVVYGRFTDVAPMQYLQSVEGQRPDVRLVNNWLIEDGFLVECDAQTAPHGLNLFKAAECAVTITVVL